MIAPFPPSGAEGEARLRGGHLLPDIGEALSPSQRHLHIRDMNQVP